MDYTSGNKIADTIMGGLGNPLVDVIRCLLGVGEIYLIDSCVVKMRCDCLIFLHNIDEFIHEKRGCDLQIEIIVSRL